MTPELDEKQVEEVHCAECNAPIPSIPNWYAAVKVRFTCDNCRQKSPRLPVHAGLETAPATRAPADVETEPALEEVDLDNEAAEDLDVEVEDADAADAEE
jgi:hypothetical protein